MAIIPADKYNWLTYNHSVATTLVAKNQKHTVTLIKGLKWGWRKSSNGKEVRIIVEEFGPTIVFTVTVDELTSLQGKSK